MFRLLVAVSVLLALAAGGFTAVAAQDATPAAGESLLAGMGYPELRITVTEDAAEAPTEVAAGRYLVVLENASQQAVDASPLQPPPGTSLDDMMASPVAEEEVPAWIYEAVLAGGPSAQPGATASVVLDLTAGEWAIQIFRDTGEEDAPAEATPEVAPAGDEAEEEPLRLTVTGEAAAAEDPAADVTVEMQEYAFVMPDQLPAGPQVWEVVNEGAQPHEIVLLELAPGVSPEQALEMLLSPEVGRTEASHDASPVGSPAVSGPPPFQPIGGMQAMATGLRGWVMLDLEPGTYVAVCGVPDPQSGQPHLMLGMVATFTVE